MTIPGKHKNFGKDANVITRRYRGPDRRKPDQSSDEPEVERTVRFDDKGNPVLDVRTNAPRRREDDKTVDLLKCLDGDIEGLALEED
jgi:hypothetical protein